MVVLGPNAHREVVDHTLQVLRHFEIPFVLVGWKDLANDFVDVPHPSLGVIVFETAYAYTDEHIRLPEGVFLPILRVITDSAPPSVPIPTETAFMATAGTGIAGAVNAGIEAARILARTDAALAALLVTNPYRIP